MAAPCPDLEYRAYPPTRVQHAPRDLKICVGAAFFKKFLAETCRPQASHCRGLLEAACGYFRDQGAEEKPGIPQSTREALLRPTIRKIFFFPGRFVDSGLHPLGWQDQREQGRRVAHRWISSTPIARSWAKAGRCKARGVTEDPDPGIAAGAEAGLSEAEEQQSRERQAGSFFQGAR